MKVGASWLINREGFTVTLDAATPTAFSLFATGEKKAEGERGAGIARLLAEAYCSLLRKQGTRKEAEKNPLDANTKYDFLQ